MGYKLNERVQSGGVPMHLVKPMLDSHSIPYFVETGTAGGQTAIEASKHFKRVWTIELIKNRAEIKSFPSNVTYIEGDSANLLPNIVQELKGLRGDKKNQYVIFYLDAHYSDIVPNTSGHPECPVIHEINHVADYGEDAVLIIDDARYFLGHPPHPHDPTQWPSIDQVIILLRDKFPFHKITLTDDYILCIPLHLREVIDREWRDKFSVRYPDEKEKLRIESRNVFNAAMKMYNEFVNYISKP